LKHEVNLLSSLDHPFIVKYISFEEDNHELAMVMEYFTLVRWIKVQKQLRKREREMGWGFPGCRNVFCLWWMIFPPSKCTEYD